MIFASSFRYILFIFLAVLREYSEYARTQEECSRLAQNRLNSIAMGLVSGVKYRPKPERFHRYE